MHPTPRELSRSEAGSSTGGKDGECRIIHAGGFVLNMELINVREHVYWVRVFLHQVPGYCEVCEQCAGVHTRVD